VRGIRKDATDSLEPKPSRNCERSLARLRVNETVNETVSNLPRGRSDRFKVAKVSGKCPPFSGVLRLLNNRGIYDAVKIYDKGSKRRFKRGRLKPKKRGWEFKLAAAMPDESAPTRPGLP
jgi:hypothetical protein